MVKIFVGNLAEDVGSERLRNLFLEHVGVVEECDVLKNYAFVHVESEEDADIVIEKLDKYTLDGKELHVERSTSNLRKQPGMSDKCFTCGVEDHRTSECPRNPNRKRNTTNYQYDPLVKKPRPLILPGSQTDDMFFQKAQPLRMTQSQQQKQQCWGYKIDGNADADPELPCPQNPELRLLYEQYLESRNRYFFYREQLSKELRLQQQYASFSSSSSGYDAQQTNPQIISRIDLTQFGRQKEQVAMPLITPRNFIPPTIPQPTNSTPNAIPSVLSHPNAPTNTIFIGANGNETHIAYASNTTSAYQPTYPTVPTAISYYNNLPAAKTSTPIKQQPTPLAAIQPFGYNLSK